MKQKFKPGETVLVSGRFSGGLDLGTVVLEDAIGWVVGAWSSTHSQVRLAQYPEHPEGRPWRLPNKSLTRLKTGDGADA